MFGWIKKLFEKKYILIDMSTMSEPIKKARVLEETNRTYLVRVEMSDYIEIKPWILRVMKDDPRIVEVFVK